jgi:membrane associated rhomboid family serine protease
VLWGVLPGQRGISWEGHLFGFVGGVAAARLLVPSKPRERSVPMRPAAG